MGKKKRKLTETERAGLADFARGMYADSFRLKYDYALCKMNERIQQLDAGIEYSFSRIKAPLSTADKLRRKGRDITLEAAEKYLNDIAGICIVCCYIDDVYEAARQLEEQEGITLIKKKDFIKSPKATGYRSLHLIFEMEDNRGGTVRVEVQIRTLSMDAWARLDHELRYKKEVPEAEKLSDELRECADMIAYFDEKMQSIHRKLVPVWAACSTYPINGCAAAAAQ